MKVLIAGATGVVGRRLIPLLLAEGHQVTAIGRDGRKRAALQRLGARPVEADLYSVRELRDAVTGHDAVINLATSIPSPARLLLPGAWRQNDRLRRIAAANISEAASRENVKRLIQESFALAYQDQGDSWIDESSPLQTSSHTHSILDAERAAEMFTDSGGDGVALRFAQFYGPDSSQTLGLIKLASYRIAAMPGPDDQYLSSISLDDAASAVIAALKVEPGIYNVSDDEPIPKREYFASLAEALGVAPPRLLPRWAKYMLGSVGDTLSRSLRISNGKLRGETGWTPKIPSVREAWSAIVTEIASESAS